MQPTEEPETDRTSEVVPAIRHNVPWRVNSARTVGNARLQVTFVDGTTGEVDMAGFLSNPKINDTVFESLRNPAIFAQAQVALGVVQWPNGADLAPDAMYDAIREHEIWIVD